LNGNTKVETVTAAAEPTFGGTGGADATVGWVYHSPTGKIFATTKSGTKIYNEATGANADD
jgi:hypothetical protein